MILTNQFAIKATVYWMRKLKLEQAFFPQLSPGVGSATHILWVCLCLIRLGLGLDVRLSAWTMYTQFPKKYQTFTDKGYCAGLQY